MSADSAIPDNRTQAGRADAHRADPDHVQINVHQATRQMTFRMDDCRMITVLPESAKPVFSPVAFLRGSTGDQRHAAGDRVLTATQNPSSSPMLETLQVAPGLDIADSESAKRLDVGDLVVTSDIPVAAEAMEKGGLALGPRGERHTRDNMEAQLNIRDFPDTMRVRGLDTGGPRALNQSSREAFADHPDRLLTRGWGRHDNRLESGTLQPSRRQDGPARGMVYISSNPAERLKIVFYDRDG